VNDLFLGLIAAAVTIMAAIQVAAVVFAMRAAARVGEAVSRFEQQVKPIVANLHAVSSTRCSPASSNRRAKGSRWCRASSRRCLPSERRRRVRARVRRRWSTRRIRCSSGKNLIDVHPGR
jgi:hypothetical protein